MRKTRFLLAVLLAAVAGCYKARLTSGQQEAPITIVYSSQASGTERLAAKEIRRYLYLRTGKLLPLLQRDDKPSSANGLIIIGQKDRRIIQNLLQKNPTLKTSVSFLKSQQYKIKTLKDTKKPTVLICGGDEFGTLYGAYRFIEHFGVRFYLHGDVLPDKKISLKMPDLDERGKPLFELRGIHPFHDFPEGPDWWNVDDYKAILAQLPKLRMNFFGLHCYPEDGVGPEPAVWIGKPGDVYPDGRVKFSSQSRHFTTHNGTADKSNSCGYPVNKKGIVQIL